jgi:acyl-CoA dehydrogenase
VDSEDFEGIRSVVRDFVRTTVVPVENDIDENDEVPTEIREAAKKMGLFGFALPEAYGGLGLSMEEESRVVIELGYTTPALRSMFGTNNGIAGHVLMEGGTPGQKEEWLPKIASGDAVASFALTEADAGSDPSGLTTTAVREGNEWVINGAKRYITNAPLADVFMVCRHGRAAGRRVGGVRPLPQAVRTPDSRFPAHSGSHRRLGDGVPGRAEPGPGLGPRLRRRL